MVSNYAVYNNVSILSILYYEISLAAVVIFDIHWIVKLNK